MPTGVASLRLLSILESLKMPLSDGSPGSLCLMTFSSYIMTPILSGRPDHVFDQVVQR